jgi:lipoprotein LprG
MTAIRRALSAWALAVLVTLTACTSGTGDGRSPDEVLAAAKKQLDETSGVRVSLSTDKLPPSVNGILSAEGVGTHDPAFEGDLKVAAGGVTADVPVVAAEGKVFAQLPFSTGFVEIDPATYAAPDPARLMDTEGGLSALLTAAEDVERDERVRKGEDVLDTYTALVPGEVVAGIIPSASAEDDFDARFAVDDEDRVREAVVTGPFYPEADDVTYTITFDEYDTTVDITVP